MKLTITSILLAALFFGCTEQSRVKKWGGEMAIDLPVCTRLFDVTWKNSDLWYAVRPMKPGEAAENYTFIESSSWEVMEGKVTFKEYNHKTKCPPSWVDKENEQ